MSLSEIVPDDMGAPDHVEVGFVGQCPTCGNTHPSTRWHYLEKGIIVGGNIWYWYAICLSEGDLIFAKYVDVLEDETEEDDEEL